jgi:muramoyltetrapeptide carboxypeptidase
LVNVKDPKDRQKQPLAAPQVSLRAPIDVSSHKIIKPRALRKGDTVGLVAPASPIFQPGEIEFIYQWLAKLGLKYKTGEHVFSSYSDAAGTDAERAHDFMEAWNDPTIDCVLPLRGGNGSARILPLLDFKAIAARPKLLIGYSDITSLLVSIHQQTGLVCFYGPSAGSFFKASYTHHYFMKAVMSNKPIGLVTDPIPSEVWKPKYPPSRMVIAQGRAEARLTGGCMTLIRQLMGTPYELQTEGKIIFLEDLNEEPHNIDRFLSQLLLAGKLQRAAGILIAECINCRPGDSNRNYFNLNHSLEQVLRDRLGNLGIPVVYGLRFGHGDDQFTLPLGAMAKLDATKRGVRFKIEENGVQ